MHGKLQNFFENIVYSQKKYRFQPDQMGLIWKTKDAQKSHRNLTRTEFIYIFASINEKEIEFNSRFYYFLEKWRKQQASI
jgi:hypothetical protein